MDAPFAAASRAEYGFAAQATSDSRHATGRGPGVDYISQAAPGPGRDAPAPIRGRALQPEPIVSRSRGGSGLCCPGCPSAEPPAPRRLPAGRPTHPAAPGAIYETGPGTDRHAYVFHPCTRAAAAAGAAETVTGEAAAAGPVMGLGCGAEGSAFSSLGSGSRAVVGQRSGAEPCGAGGGEPGRLWEEAWERGAPGTRARLQSS